MAVSNQSIKEESDYADISVLKKTNPNSNPRLMSAAMHDTRNSRIAIGSSSAVSKHFIKRNIYGTSS